jgi:hypothetical protein
MGIMYLLIEGYKQTLILGGSFMNKGKRNGFLGILVMLLVFAMVIIGCDKILTDTGFKSIVKDDSGNTYTLTTNEIVTDMYQELEGTDYVLTIKMTDGTVETSRGIINESGIVDGRLRFILQPSVENSNAFNITLTISDKWNIRSIDGEIAVEGGSTVKSPGSIPVIAVAGGNTVMSPGNVANTTNRKGLSVGFQSILLLGAILLGIPVLVFLIGLIFPGGKGNYSYTSDGNGNMTVTYNGDGSSSSGSSYRGSSSNSSSNSSNNNNDDYRRREEDHQRKVAEARKEAERNGDAQRKFVGY